jgi:hypothetical protein
LLTVQIERTQGLSPDVFARDHLQGIGRPVIVTDATDLWTARAKWTFEYLKTAYGADVVCPALGLYSNVVNVTKLATYIDYLSSPVGELQGFWMDAVERRPLRTPPASAESPPYLVDWKAFDKHPELFDDIKPFYFVNDWVPALSPTLREVFECAARRSYWEVFIGPDGSLSRLHQDFQHTHACLAQISGRKRAILFSPEDSAFLYGGKVDPEHPDFARFELLRRATAYEGVLEPGDVLFIPADWWHWVRGLEKSITVDHNFFNDVNFAAHMEELLRRLPAVVEGFDKFPAWRDALHVEWQCKGFESASRRHDK